jgi:hypothetical protein
MPFGPLETEDLFRVNSPYIDGTEDLSIFYDNKQTVAFESWDDPIDASFFNNSSSFDAPSYLSTYQTPAAKLPVPRKLPASYPPLRHRPRTVKPTRTHLTPRMRLTTSSLSEHETSLNRNRQVTHKTRKTGNDDLPTKERPTKPSTIPQYTSESLQGQQGELLRENSVFKVSNLYLSNIDLEVLTTFQQLLTDFEQEQAREMRRAKTFKPCHIFKKNRTSCSLGMPSESSVGPCNSSEASETAHIGTSRTERTPSVVPFEQKNCRGLQSQTPTTQSALGVHRLPENLASAVLRNKRFCVDLPQQCQKRRDERKLSENFSMTSDELVNGFRLSMLKPAQDDQFRSSNWCWAFPDMPSPTTIVSQTLEEKVAAMKGRSMQYSTDEQVRHMLKYFSEEKATGEGDREISPGSHFRTTPPEAKSPTPDTLQRTQIASSSPRKHFRHERRKISGSTAPSTPSRKTTTASNSSKNHVATSGLSKRSSSETTVSQPPVIGHSPKNTLEENSPSCGQPPVSFAIQCEDNQGLNTFQAQGSSTLSATKFDQKSAIKSLPSVHGESSSSRSNTLSSFTDDDSDWGDDEAYGSAHDLHFSSFSAFSSKVALSQEQVKDSLTHPVFSPMKKELINRLMKEFWVIFNQENEVNQ